jgi:hypothetical protein
MINRNTLLALAVSAATAFPYLANAGLNLSLTPSAQTVNVGDLASVDIWANGVKSTGNAIGGFSIFLNYNGNYLSVPGVSFGTYVSDFPDSGAINANQFYAGNTSFGFPTDILASQPDSFKLATFTFQTLQLGTSHLSIDATSSFSNVDGTGTIDFTASDATLTAVPEPGTCVSAVVMALLVGIPAARRKLAAA